MPDYDTETGEYRTTLDGGETLERLYVDSDGEDSLIRIRGECHIKNVGIENVSHESRVIHVLVPEGETAVIEDTYLNGGANNIFVHEKHAGTLILRRVHGTGCEQDFIYSSPPGNPEYDSGKANPEGGQNGTTILEDCYGEGIPDFFVRLGHGGSYAEGCVGKDVGVAYSNHYGKASDGGIRFEDCHARADNIGLKHIDHDDRNVGEWDEEVLTILEDFHVAAPQQLDRNETAAGQGEIRGEIQGNPDLTPPTGVPMSADDAARGDSGSGADDGDSDRDTDAMQELEIRSENVATGYRVQTTDAGRIEPVSNTVGSRTGDEQIDDQTFAGGIGPDDPFDRFRVEGEIEQLDIEDPADLTLLLDGSEISREELVVGSEDGDKYGSPDEPRRFYIYGDDWQGENDEPIFYTVAIDGEADLADKADRFDEIAEYGDSDLHILSGSVPANSDDAFSIVGEVAWMHGPRERLNFQLNKEPYEPPWRGDDPLGRDGEDEDDTTDEGGGDGSDSGDESEGPGSEPDPEPDPVPPSPTDPAVVLESIGANPDTRLLTLIQAAPISAQTPLSELIDIDRELQTGDTAAENEETQS
jgi:hypothetical protein